MLAQSSWIKPKIRRDSPPQHRSHFVFWVPLCVSPKTSAVKWMILFKFSSDVPMCQAVAVRRLHSSIKGIGLRYDGRCVLSQV
jgi:hypothetical protein